MEHFSCARFLMQITRMKHKSFDKKKLSVLFYLDNQNLYGNVVSDKIKYPFIKKLRGSHGT